jgi:hypothetical protein
MNAIEDLLFDASLYGEKALGEVVSSHCSSLHEPMSCCFTAPLLPLESAEACRGCGVVPQ